MCTRDAVSQKATGDEGIRNESRIATKCYFNQLNKTQGNNCGRVEELPFSRSTEHYSWIRLRRRLRKTAHKPCTHTLVCL